MTDFIHEHPKDEPTPSAPPAETPPMDEETGQKRVYGYIFILFIVAFSLLLWSFLMNQRGTDQVLSELRGNADALQTTLTRNVELEQQADAMQDELDTLREELQSREQEIARLNEAVAGEKERADARGLLWLAEYRLERGEYDLCRETMAELEKMRGALQTEAGAAYPSELARYEEIAAILDEPQ